MDDRQLTQHFRLFDLTKTSHADLQEKNRELTEDQLLKLTEVAKLLEHVLWVLATPITVTSGYRCYELNKFLGSTEKSQHRLCEAADFVPKMDLGESFRKLWKDVKENGANVGQLIHETQDGKSWIHISLGTPYRPEAKSKQILRFENGIYTLLA